MTNRMNNLDRKRLAKISDGAKMAEQLELLNNRKNEDIARAREALTEQIEQINQKYLGEMRTLATHLVEQGMSRSGIGRILGTKAQSTYSQYVDATGTKRQPRKVQEAPSTPRAAVPVEADPDADTFESAQTLPSLITSAPNIDVTVDGNSLTVALTNVPLSLGWFNTDFVNSSDYKRIHKEEFTGVAVNTSLTVTVDGFDTEWVDEDWPGFSDQFDMPKNFTAPPVPDEWTQFFGGLDRIPDERSSKFNRVKMRLQGKWPEGTPYATLKLKDNPVKFDGVQRLVYEELTEAPFRSKLAYTVFHAYRAKHRDALKDFTATTPLVLMPPFEFDK